MESGDHERDSSWRFLIDENLNPEIVDELRRFGIDAEHILTVLFAGADDFEDILPHCRETGTILVTNNVVDFNPTSLSRDDHVGIVIVHDKNRPAAEIAAELKRIVEAYPDPEVFRGFESADDWTND